MELYESPSLTEIFRTQPPSWKIGKSQGQIARGQGEAAGPSKRSAEFCPSKIHLLAWCVCFHYCCVAWGDWWICTADTDTSSASPAPLCGRAGRDRAEGGMCSSSHKTLALLQSCKSSLTIAGNADTPETDRKNSAFCWLSYRGVIYPKAQNLELSLVYLVWLENVLIMVIMQLIWLREACLK